MNVGAKLVPSDELRIEEYLPRHRGQIPIAVQIPEHDLGHLLERALAPPPLLPPMSGAGRFGATQSDGISIASSSFFSLLSNVQTVAPWRTAVMAYMAS